MVVERLSTIFGKKQGETPEAERLLTAYRTLETEVNTYSQERFHALFDSL